MEYSAVRERQEQLEAVFGPVCARTHCDERRRQTLEEVIQLAVEIAREGREGRKIGTLFVVGDLASVRERSRALILDPLMGHPPEVLHIARPELWETIKELAQLDGSFLVDDDGTFVSAGRLIEVDLAKTTFLPGLGGRHAAAASITATTGAVAVVVSESSVVRVFAGGEIRAEIIPELFLMSGRKLLTPEPAVRQLPEAGLTLAVAGETS